MVGRIGVASGAAYLFVLPYGHLTALRSLAFVLALLAAAVIWAKSLRRLPFASLFGIWLAAAVLSLVASRDLFASLEAMERDIVRSFLVFFVFYTLSATSPFYRTAVAATATGMAVLSALAIASVFEYGRWTSYYVPLLGEFTTSATTVLPLLAGYLFVPDRNPRLLLLVLIALPLTLLAGHLTLSRAFWVVAACAIVVALLLHLLRGGRLSRRPLFMVASVALAGLVLAAAAAYEKNRSPIDFADREMIYSSAIRKIVGNPLTGAGYGHETDKRWYAAAMPDQNVFHAHNIVLGFIDQMGAAGLIALAAIFGIPALTLVRQLRSVSAEAPVACICGLVLLAVVFLRNNVDYFFLKHNLWLFFAHLGIYIGEIHRRLSPASPRAGSRGPASA